MELDTSSLSDLTDKQLIFLNKHKDVIHGDRLQIALAIDKEARKQGINPEFVWPMVMQESKFNPEAISPKGAYGVMQLMPDTSKSFNVDPKNLQQNISGGISLLKELTSNEKIGNDPYKVLAGYNTSTETRNKFYASGDLADLPDETIKHMYAVGKFYGGDLPKTNFESQTSEAPAPTAEEVPNQSDAETQRLTNQNLAAGPVYKEGQNSPAMAGSLGALGGATVGEAAAIVKAKKDALDYGFRTASNYIQGKAPTEFGGETPGGKWGAKTGYGVGEGTVEDANAKYKRMKPQGKISGRMADRFGFAKPGESPDLVQRMIDRQKLAEAAALEANAAAKTAPLGWAKRLVSWPLKGAVGGFGLLAGAQDVYNRNEIGAKGEALASGLSSLAGAASPYIGAVAGPLVGGGALATQLMLSAKDRDRYLQQHPEDFILEDTDVDPLGNRIR
jgi:hypothetical protein